MPADPALSPAKTKLAVTEEPNPKFSVANASPPISTVPRVTTGDVREEPIEVLEMSLRDVLVGCGLSEVVTYSFIHPDYNRLFSSTSSAVRPYKGGRSTSSRFSMRYICPR